MARQARRLVEKEGIMTSPNPRQGKKSPAEVVEKVEQFCCCDEISRLMPGKKRLCYHQSKVERRSRFKNFHSV